MSEVPCVTYMALYILTFHVLQSNSRTSTLWKLNPEDGKIIEASSNFPHLVTTIRPSTDDIPVDDPIFNIITSTVHYGKTWTKRGVDNNNFYCTDCEKFNDTKSNSET